MAAIDTAVQPAAPVAERTVSAIFKEQQQIDSTIRRLLDRGVSRDDISVIGKNFHSETKIAGFITKKDVILGGLRQGAIFGSIFGSALALLSGVGVLFVPFVGTLVAAGPLGAALIRCSRWRDRRECWSWFSLRFCSIRHTRREGCCLSNSY